MGLCRALSACGARPHAALEPGALDAEWVNKLDFGARPVAAAGRMLQAHIKTVCSRYSDRIFSYDVVNETIAPPAATWRNHPSPKPWDRRLIDFCFHAAREAAPKASSSTTIP